MAQQCCPSGSRPETPRRPSAGGLRIFWVKSLVILAIYTKIKLKFVYMAVITSDIAQKIRRPPAEGLRGVSRRFPLGHLAGPHDTYVLVMNSKCLTNSAATNLRSISVQANVVIYIISTTDYGHPKEPLSIFWAWSDKFWGIWVYTLVQFISTNFGAVSPLSMFFIIQPFISTKN